jgi:hypothetical protein
LEDVVARNSSRRQRGEDEWRRVRKKEKEKEGIVRGRKGGVYARHCKEGDLGIRQMSTITRL